MIALNLPRIVRRACGLLLLLLPVTAQAAEPFSASRGAIELDRQIDWSRAKLIAVQDAQRYKTIDSFAREQFAAMYGEENLPGLSPMASLCEWLFNRAAYADSPVIRVKDLGLRMHFTSKMPEAQRIRILRTRYMTPREMNDAGVQRSFRELQPRTQMAAAINRAGRAFMVAAALEDSLLIIPPRSDDPQAGWHPITQLLANAVRDPEAKADPRDLAQIHQDFGAPIPGYTPQQATAVAGPWFALERSWRAADAAGVQQALDQLAERIPQLEPRVYPPVRQRQLESLYYLLGRMNWGWLVYLFGALVSVLALVTGWRAARWSAIGVLILALSIHIFAIALRWVILERIPAANMFEALTFSAACAILVALLLEFFFPMRIFVLAANVGGFVAFLLAAYVVPGGGTLTSIMAILDDLMLRIHTTLIIASYGLVFIAGVIALVYLFTYYVRRAPGRSLEAGLFAAFYGMALLVAVRWGFEPSATAISGFVKQPGVGPGAALATGLLALLMLVLARRGPVTLRISLGTALVATAALAIGDHSFTWGMAWCMLIGGVVWAGCTGVAMLMEISGVLDAPQLATAGEPALALAGGPTEFRQTTLRLEDRPVLAGAMPGDEASGRVPEFLKRLDWCHLIVLNMVFILLFVGTILGAVWADYSWGRPWGWDPKEVFALNTWIIYAILIHVRFIVKDRGLWTAWLSVIGCLMMVFNWCFVNFYLVGLHSYA